ncbi:MAG TPA: hypothetical protein VI316_04565 [Candidatus Dormibacteraeota bacterium]
MELSCPRCLTTNDAAAEHCRRCYGSLAAARQQLGHEPAVAVDEAPVADAAAPLVAAAAAVPASGPTYSAATPFAAGSTNVADSPTGGPAGTSDPVPTDAPEGSAPPGNGSAVSAGSGGNGWAVRESPRAAAMRLSGDEVARPVRSAPAPATEAPLGVPATWPASTHGPAPRRRPGGLGLLGGVVGLLSTRAGMRFAALALVGVLGAGLFGRHYLNGASGTHAISLPATIAGETKVTGYGAIDSAMASYNQMVHAQKDVKQVLSAVYGRVNGDQTSLVDAYELHLVLVSRQSLTTDDVLNALAADNPDISVDRAGAVTKTINGTDFQCTPINDPRAPGATDVACLWQDSDVVGVLWAYSAANADIVANTAAQVEHTAETRIS